MPEHCDRIAIITPGFSRDSTDWCIPAQLDLTRGLSRAFQLCVFALQYPFHRSPYSIESIEVKPMAGGNRRGPLRGLLILRALAAIVEEHRRRPFAVLHALWADEPGFIAAAAGRLINRPALVSICGGELVKMDDISYGGQRSLINRQFLRIALRRAAKVTVGSSYLQGLAGLVVSKNKLARIPLGVHTQRFQSTGEQFGFARHTRGQRNLLHVASLNPVKDQEMLLRCMSEIIRVTPDVYLHVIGEGPARSSLETLRAQLELEKNVTFHGAVRHEHLPAYYRAADLCLLSSRFESQGMVILEAGACGRTTVGTAVGLLPELHPAPPTVPVGDSDGLAKLITELLPKREALEELNRCLSGCVRSDYSVEKSVSRFSRLYESVARENPS